MLRLRTARLLTICLGIVLMAGCASRQNDEAQQAVKVQQAIEEAQKVIPDITFEFDSAKISSTFYSALNRLAASLQKFDEESIAIKVVGHTDSTGSRAVNMHLSKRRAQSVVSYLKQQNIPKQQISSYGVGDDYPVASNASASGRAENRRVEITLSPLPR